MNRINVILDSTFRVEFFLTYQAFIFPSLKFTLQRKTKAHHLFITVFCYRANPIMNIKQEPSIETY